MNPLGLHRVEPGALLGQKAAYDSHSGAAVLNFPVVRGDPLSGLFGDVPRSVVPDQNPNPLASRLKLLATPREKAGRYAAYRTAIHKAQPHLLELRHEQPVARDGLRVGVVLGNRLFDEAQRLTSFASPASLQLWRAGLASLLNQVSSKKPTTHSGRPSARPINRSRRLFFERSGDLGK